MSIGLGFGLFMGGGSGDGGGGLPPESQFQIMTPFGLVTVETDDTDQFMVITTTVNEAR